MLPQRRRRIVSMLAAAGCGLFLAVTSVAFLGVPFGRFLVRALPPDVSGARRPAVFWIAGVLALVAPSFISLTLAVLIGGAQTPPSDAASTPAGTPGVFTLAWLAGATGPLVLRHLSPRRFLDQPFVLFLRRFSTFSDRAVTSVVVRLARPGRPIVFLTPTHSQPNDWSPVLVGFEGMKALHPFRSVPIVLRAKDEDWQRAAEELIARADLILLDISEVGGSMGIEADLIQRAGRWPDTICLRQMTRGATPASETMRLPLDVLVISYVKSWARELPGAARLRQCALLGAFLVGMGMWGLLIFTGIVIVAIAHFAMPTIDPRTRETLRQLIQGALHP